MAYPLRISVGFLEPGARVVLERFRDRITRAYLPDGATRPEQDFVDSVGPLNSIVNTLREAADPLHRTDSVRLADGTVVQPLTRKARSALRAMREALADKGAVSAEDMDSALTALGYDPREVFTSRPAPDPAALGALKHLTFDQARDSLDDDNSAQTLLENLRDGLARELHMASILSVVRQAGLAGAKDILERAAKIQLPPFEESDAKIGKLPIGKFIRKHGPTFGPILKGIIGRVYLRLLPFHQVRQRLRRGEKQGRRIRPVRYPQVLLKELAELLSAQFEHTAGTFTATSVKGAVAEFLKKHPSAQVPSPIPELDIEAGLGIKKVKPDSSRARKSTKRKTISQ